MQTGIVQTSEVWSQDHKSAFTELCLFCRSMFWFYFFLSTALAVVTWQLLNHYRTTQSARPNENFALCQESHPHFGLGTFEIYIWVRGVSRIESWNARGKVKGAQEEEAVDEEAEAQVKDRRRQSFFIWILLFQRSCNLIIHEMTAKWHLENFTLCEMYKNNKKIHTHTHTKETQSKYGNARKSAEQCVWV